MNLEVFPGLVVAAVGKKYTDDNRTFTAASALRLWHIARFLDKSGEGRVAADSLKAEAVDLFGRDTYYRAMREAEFIGLVLRVNNRRRAGLGMVELRSVEHVAKLLDVPNVGARKVSVPLDCLTKTKKFKAALFAAFHAGRSHKTGRPISRKTLTNLTGVSRSSQRRYERATGTTTATPNAKVIGTTTPDASRGALEHHREHTHGACFVAGALILRPLPNTYTSALLLGSRSKATKINRSLQRGLVLTHAGQRVFFDKAKAAERAARKGKAVDIPLARLPALPGVVGGLWAPVVDSWAARWVSPC